MKSAGNNFLVLVDPLPDVCDKLKSHVHDNTHEKITVKVMKAADILDAYLAKGNRVYKLKTDMQGSDMTALENLRPILSKPDQVTHLKSECFIPNA
eukprot:s5734_g1.t1